MSENLQAILWALLASILVALVSVMAKIAVTDFHVLQILFIRQMFILFSVLPSVLRDFPKSLKTKHPFIHALRLLGAFVALSTGVWALAVLPLTTAITLAFSQVLFVALLAFIFLKEMIDLPRATAVILGFIGVVIVMHPSLDGFINIYALIPIIGALATAVAVISVRKLSQTESTATLLAYQAIFVGLLAGIPLFWLWIEPNFTEFMLLITMGIVATAANWVGVKALRLAEASLTSNIEYVKLIYAAIFGYFLFDEIPDNYTIIGAFIIVAASVYMFRHEAKKKQHSDE